MTADEILRTVVAAVESICEDREIEPDEPINPKTRLIEELGLASVDFVQLIVTIEEAIGRKVGFHELIMPDGGYVSEMTVQAVVEFLERRINGTTYRPSVAPGNLASVGTAPSLPVLLLPKVVAPRDDFGSSRSDAGFAGYARARIDEAKYARFRAIMPAPGAVEPQSSERERNPRCIFLLSSPRSGSTLLRVMLAGNPGLFAPPELFLLCYRTMAERRVALDNDLNRHLLSGAVAAWSRAVGCSVDLAEHELNEAASRATSTLGFYRQLQERLGDRLLVDKTPIYTFYRETLQRAEDSFDHPLYVHLVRHPGGMVQSYQDARMERFIPFLRESSFTRREIAELVWILGQRNVTEFLSQVPASRQHRVHYEELVRRPEPTVRELCSFLGVDYHSAMLHPYADKVQRMTDGVREVVEFGGDLKFHLHKDVDPTAADRWRDHLDPESLSTIARRIATSLGIPSGVSAGSG